MVNYRNLSEAFLKGFWAVGTIIHQLKGLRESWFALRPQRRTQVLGDDTPALGGPCGSRLFFVGVGFILPCCRPATSQAGSQLPAPLDSQKGKGTFPALILVVWEVESMLMHHRIEVVSSSEDVLSRRKER